MGDSEHNGHVTAENRRGFSAEQTERRLQESARGRGEGSRKLADTGLLGQAECEKQTAGVEQCGEGSRELVNAPIKGFQKRTPRQARRSSSESEPERPDGSGERQAEPPLGLHTDGTANRMGYGELCVSYDNRTDELRLLGNGVVPATATKAFLTLMEKF
jgi:hypothetical protein